MDVGYIFCSSYRSSFVRFWAFEKAKAKRTLLLLLTRRDSLRVPVFTFLEDTEMAVSGDLWAP